jgi:hypothetical protein
MAMIIAAIFAAVSLSVAVSGSSGSATSRIRRRLPTLGDSPGSGCFWEAIAIGLGSLAWWIERSQRNADDS